MIGNKLEQSIISVFQNNPDKTYSINELSKILKKSYPHINHKANFFLKEKVLKKVNIGNSYQCYLNLKNDKTMIYLKINEVNRLDYTLKSDKILATLQEEIVKISKEDKISSAIVKNDTIIIISEQHHVKSISGYRTVSMTIAQFKEALLTDHDLQQNHIVLYGIDNYLKLYSELEEKFVFKSVMKNLEAKQR